jgi:hypothetical protein
LIATGGRTFTSPNAESVDTALAGKKARTALYHNNRDGTFTDVTDKAGRGLSLLGHGRGRGRLQQLINTSALIANDRRNRESPKPSFPGIGGVADSNQDVSG